MHLLQLYANVFLWEYCFFGNLLDLLHVYGSNNERRKITTTKILWNTFSENFPTCCPSLRLLLLDSILTKNRFIYLWNIMQIDDTSALNVVWRYNVYNSNVSSHMLRLHLYFISFWFIYWGSSYTEFGRKNQSWFLNIDVTHDSKGG